MNPSDLPAREREKIELYTRKESADREDLVTRLDAERAGDDARASADHVYRQRWARWHRTRAERHKRAEVIARDEFRSMFVTCAIADIHLMMSKWHERRADYHDAVWN